MSSEEAAENASQQAPAAPEIESIKLTDPKVMRALAHPVRMALLELLTVRDMTATQASEVLGESPANCAFHLRTLAKYGFAEEAGGGKGRERPWRIKPRTISINADKLDDPQAKLAAEALGDLFHTRMLTRITAALAKRDDQPGGFGTPHSSYSLVYMTPEEADALSHEAIALVNKYVERRTKPELRPPGALPVEFDYFIFPAAGAADAGADAGAEAPLAEETG
jgi:predicted transcriptional regulator